MSEIHPPEDQSEQEALLWQARMSSDLLTEEQKRNFETWLAASTANAEAWQSVNGFWAGLDSLKLEDIAGSQSAAGAGSPSKPAVKWFSPAFAMAAGVVLAVITYPDLESLGADYRSATGQQKTVNLADGSTVTLNTGSAITVDFSEQQRTIRLLEGEAFFQVAADRSRPFVVETQAGQVQALGTEFDIRAGNNRSVVTVFEHSVKVTTLKGEVKDKLLASEQLEYGEQGLGTAVRVNLQRSGAWRSRRMIFQDRPLAEVVAELGRYRPGVLLITDDAIRKLPVTGIFGTDNTDIALASIEQSLPVKVTRITAKLVLLSAKKPPPA